GRRRHGLSPSCITRMRSALATRTRANGPVPPHQPPWLVPEPDPAPSVPGPEPEPDPPTPEPRLGGLSSAAGFFGVGLGLIGWPETELDPPPEPALAPWPGLPLETGLANPPELPS